MNLKHNYDILYSLIKNYLMVILMFEIEIRILGCSTIGTKFTNIKNGF